MKTISFSQLQRVYECPASQVIPWVDSPPAEATSFGTRQHERLEQLIETGLAPLENGDVSFHGIPTVGMYAEDAFAIDLRNGSVIPLGKLPTKRAYPDLVGGDFVVGTVDSWKPGYVGELKTGNGEILPPKDNLQVRAQAYCVKKDGYTKAVIYIRRQDGYSQDLEADFDEFDHEQTLGTLRLTVKKAKESSGEDVREGPHCTYCPAQVHCPAKRARLKALMTSEEAFLTKETAPDIYLRFRAAQGLMNGLETQIKAYSMGPEGPIDVGNGKVYGPVERNGESINGRKLWDFLAYKYGSEVAWLAVNVTSSKALLDGVMQYVNLPKDELLKELRKSGILKSYTQESFREHKK